MSFLHCYRKHRFNKQTQDTVAKATTIINDLGAQGYKLTLRQLYYQFVSKGFIENTEQSYKRLGRLVTKARESGIMDWVAIEDRGRNINSFYTEEDPTNLVDGLEDSLVYDLWARQDNYVEVWVEKQALEGVIERPCRRLHTPYMACKGYLSASEAWRSGLRFQNALAEGKNCVILHLGDHDPSGLHMTDDCQDRVRMFAEDHGITVRRLALNMDQVEQYNPPPNPAKEQDLRAPAYIKRFGKKSWELDALEPKVLDELITKAIEEYRDVELWNKTLEEQAEARKPLEALSDNWDEIKALMIERNMI